MKISEKSFEEAIEVALLASGPDAASDSEVVERGSAYGQVRSDGTSHRAGVVVPGSQRLQEAPRVRAWSI
jgi:hypothetical protein